MVQPDPVHQVPCAPSVIIGINQYAMIPGVMHFIHKLDIGLIGIKQSKELSFLVRREGLALTYAGNQADQKQQKASFHHKIHHTDLTRS